MKLPLALTAALLCGAPIALAAVPLRPAVHCQIPCGIYGDSTRIDLLLEDAQTIEKGMQQIHELEGAEKPNYNQIVRWVANKDEHAQSIQDQVAAYWLAQRIKAPAGGDAAVRAIYLRQLELMHGITVAAMKCKQTTELSHVQALREHVHEFAATYFDEAALEHMKAHHGK